eukprot:3281107-Pyramimonas_sp.AAC.1
MSLPPRQHPKSRPGTYVNDNRISFTQSRNGKSRPCVVCPIFALAPVASPKHRYPHYAEDGIRVDSVDVLYSRVLESARACLSSENQAH